MHNLTTAKYNKNIYQKILLLYPVSIELFDVVQCKVKTTQNNGIL